MKAAEWIDRLKAERGWDSDYRVAKELGIHRATVSGYRSLRTTLDDDTAVKVAAALEVEPEIIILDQHAERTSSAPARAALSGLLAKITGKNLGGPVGGSGGKGPLDITSVAVAAVLAGASLFGSPPSEAHQVASATEVRIVSRRRRRARHPLSPLAQLARALLQLPAAPVGAFA